MPICLFIFGSRKLRKLIYSACNDSRLWLILMRSCNVFQTVNALLLRLMFLFPFFLRYVKYVFGLCSVYNMDRLLFGNWISFRNEKYFHDKIDKAIEKFGCVLTHIRLYIRMNHVSGFCSYMNFDRTTTSRQIPNAEHPKRTMCAHISWIWIENWK